MDTARPGDTLVTFMTGEGDITPGLVDGAAPATGTAISKLPVPRLPVALTVGGVQANVLFAGITSSAAGVTQINFTVPSNVPTGASLPVVVTVGNVPAPAVNLPITAQ